MAPEGAGSLAKLPEFPGNNKIHWSKGFCPESLVQFLNSSRQTPVSFESEIWLAGASRSKTPL